MTTGKTPNRDEVEMAMNSADTPMERRSSEAPKAEKGWGELIDGHLDGQLDPAAAARFETRLAAEPQLLAEHRMMASLHRMLEADRVPVAAGFKDGVMARLPRPAWAAASIPHWAWPLAAVLVLALGASVLLGAGTTTLGEGSPLLGTGVALLDFMQATMLAGAGLLGASWRGLGLGLEEALAGSGVNLAALALAVLSLDLLVLAMLRRRRPAAAEERSPD